jgi:carbamoyltransferase
VLLNTSFNMRGEPIVCTPQDALACFVRSGLDAVVLEDVVVDRCSLPEGYRQGVEEFYSLVDLAQRVTISQDVYTLL